MATNEKIKRTFKRFVPLTNREPITWEGLVGGTALLAVGLLTRGVVGSLFTVVGGFSLAQQARKIDAVEKALEQPKQRLKTISGELRNLGESTRSVCVARKVSEIEEFLSNPDNLQKFYPAFKCTKQDSGKWALNLTKIELPKQILMDFARTEKAFEWSIGADENINDDNRIRLSVSIEELPLKAMTKLTATLECPPAVGLVTPIGKLIGKDPGSQLEKALMTSKQYLETGEVATGKRRGGE